MRQLFDLSPELLCLIDTVQSYKELAIREDILGKTLGLERHGTDWYHRLWHYYKALPLSHMGLPKTQEGLKAVMQFEITEAMRDTSYNDLGAYQLAI